MDSSRQTQNHDQDVPQAKGSGSFADGRTSSGIYHGAGQNVNRANSINAIPQAGTEAPEEHQTFTSGAASSKQNFPHHLTPVAFLRRVAGRFGLGKKNYGDINYMSAVKVLRSTHEIEVDVEFCRARWDHAFEHLLNVKEHEWLEDDNLSALAWFSAMAIRFETMGVDWHRILNPVFVNEQKIRFSTKPRETGAAPKVTRVEYAPPKQDKQVWVEDQGQQAQQVMTRTAQEMAREALKQLEPSVRPQRLQEREEAVMKRLKKTYAEPTQGELGSVSHSWRTPIYAIVAGNPTLVEAKTLGTVGGLVLDALVQAKQDVTRSSWEIRDENGRSLSQTSLVRDVLSKGERVYINLAPGVGA